MRSILALVILISASFNVTAHVILEKPTAMAGSYYRGVFQVGHGCDNSSTKQIIVNIPSGIESIRPKPVPGWRIEIDRASLATPYVGSYGNKITEEVTKIRWTAVSKGNYLLSTHYDEFVVLAKLPKTPGKIYWKINQICEEGRIDWVQIPADGKGPFDYAEPAAELEILPTTSTSHH